MELSQILAIIIIHFIADFIFQDERWANGKSKNNTSLVTHTIVYSIVFTFLLFGFQLIYEYDSNIMLLMEKVVHFGMITFVFHTITDYFTSRVVSKKFVNKEYGSSVPNFGAFTIIGFDQVLHYVQMFITYIVIFM